MTVTINYRRKESFMFKIDQKKIRQIYYAGSIIIIVLTAIILSIPVFMGVQSEYELKLVQLEESILHQKKLFLKTVITEKISDIEEIRRSLETSTPEPGEHGFDARFRRHVKEMIHNTILPDDGYVWINEIIDYEGGDKYAVRFVHPNLPDTEGDYLSTKTKDIEGNLPYLTELEGIKDAGEIYQEYYFKKMNSDEISHKLSYAKLYKPYDWVVATGIYLDDLDELISRESTNMENSTRRTLRQIFFTILGSVIVLIGFLVFFERRLEKLVQSYTESINITNMRLAEEKKKLQEAYKKIEGQAFSDSLTGLLNRRAILGYLKEEQARFERMGSCYGVLMCDIDWFKSINDTFGHQAGDYVLKELAVIMTGNLRLEDKVCRWGGEEFVCLVTNTNNKIIKDVAEKLRLAVEAQSIPWKGKNISLTMTIGMAVSEQGKSIDELINLADERLYRGKEQGRNMSVGSESA